MLLIAPYVALMTVFFLAPIAIVVFRSFEVDSQMHMAATMSFANYAEVFSSDVLRRVMARTLLIATYTTVLCFVFGFPTAYLLSRLSKTPATVLMTLILLPFWVSVLVRLFALTTVLGRNGLINSGLSWLGLGRLDLLFNTTATVVGMTNYLLPYMIIILYSGMMRVDGTLLVAARSLGATSWEAFRLVFLPQIGAVMFSAATLVFVLSLGFFLTPAVLGGSDDLTVALYIQQQIGNYRWGVASAIGVLLLAVSLFGYFLVIHLVGPSQLVGASSGGTKGVSGIERLRFSAVTVMLWILAAASVIILLVPLAVTVLTSFGEARVIQFPPKGWTFKWYEEIFTDPLWMRAIAKSLIVAIMTGLVSTLIGLGLARFTSTVRSIGARAIIQTLVYSPLVVPVILLAIGMYDIESRLGLQGTKVGLILLHAVIATPLAYAILSAALEGLDPELEAAARALGSSPARAFWTVTVPAIKGAVVGSLIISFVTSWDEAVIALFQSDFDKTLPVMIFSYIQSGVKPVVPALASLLIALVVLGVGARLWHSYSRHFRKRV